MNRKVLLQSIVTVILFFIINFGLWEVLVARGINQSWASFIVYAALVVVVILIWSKKLLKEWCRLKSEMKNWKSFFIELLIGIAIALVFAYLFQYLINGGFKTDNTKMAGIMVDTIPPILSCIMLSVFGPIIEELTFRESLIGIINRQNKIGITIMMIISIIVFDCIHLYRWQEFFYYLPLAIVLTVFYVKHNRNVFSSIIMHALFNLPGAIMMIIGAM